jgi:hypothetical protein
MLVCGNFATACIAARLYATLSGQDSEVWRYGREWAAQIRDIGGESAPRAAGSTKLGYYELEHGQGAGPAAVGIAYPKWQSAGASAEASETSVGLSWDDVDEGRTLPHFGRDDEVAHYPDEGDDFGDRGSLADGWLEFHRDD